MYKQSVRYLTAPAIATIFAITGLTVGGCGGESSDSAKVTGQVTLDGQPLTSGSVVTIPQQGRGARGEIDANGRFELITTGVGDGAVLGTHRVAVTCFAASGDVGGGPEAVAKSLIPGRYGNAYNSGLTIDVKPGQINEVMLELSSASD